MNNYVTGSYAANAYLRLKNFVVKNIYPANTFDEQNTTYTAPKSGIYTLSYTISFNGKYNGNSNAFLSGRWVVDDGNGNLKPSAGNVVSYPVGSGQASLSVTESFYLNEGDKVYPEIYHTLSNTQDLCVGNSNAAFNFNYLSIVYAQ